MNKKLIKSIILTGILIFSTLLVACGSDEADVEPDFHYTVQDFEYINQDEETVSLEDLKGKYWVADFVFTNCVTVCPPMTANMAKLQNMAKDAGLDVHFVSFTVDPNLDGPKELKEYAQQYEADLSNWDFLTGYSQEHIESFAAKSFKSLVSKVEGFDQVNHVVTFYIVSPEGEAIHAFSGTKQEEMEIIIDHLKAYTK
ncbi:SCO family protein [Bacillaceae bacterium W0354]